MKVSSDTESQGNTARFQREHVCYFDFECSTDGVKHLPYCVCSVCSYEDHTNPDSVGIRWEPGHWYGADCAKRFLQSLSTNTLCYAHNLSYDITFVIHHLDYIHNGAIIKDGRVMQLTGVYKGRTLTFKDTYTIISTRLSRFPSMFGLECGLKEAFPYTYYTSDRIGNTVGSVSEALMCLSEADQKTFTDNLQRLGMRNGDTFDMEGYCVFYCRQDVNLLHQGFEWFRGSLLQSFGLDTYSFLSISSIANRNMEEHCYWPNGKLYDLSNTPRDFISRCVIGGRCMIADNEKQRSDEDLVDFDAVSLYPSAMHRLYCLEGVPKVLTDDMKSTEWLLGHLFTDEQTEPTFERPISGFYVQVRIEAIGVPRHFPLIVNSSAGCERSSNVCCEMYVDHIQFEDLVRFQQCEMKVLRGYYYDGNRDPTIRTVIGDLFELRLKYKREGNPLQEVIKLLLNSIYGKTILKPITDTVRFVPKESTMEYFDRRYQYVKEVEHTMDKFCKVTETKSITRHFTFTPLGVSILSMSKRIMNEVMCLAEDMGIRLWYQDTDSMHLRQRDLEGLSQEYRRVYGRDLIGKSMGTFHSDFPLVGGVISQSSSSQSEMPVARRSLFCGKKCYIDELHGGEDVAYDSQSEACARRAYASGTGNAVAYHVRMKGVPLSVIVRKAKELFGGDPYIGTDGLVHNGECVWRLYEELYNGAVMELDLAKGDSPCFERGKDFTMSTKDSFVRRISFGPSESGRQ